MRQLIFEDFKLSEAGVTDMNLYRIILFSQGILMLCQVLPNTGHQTEFYQVKFLDIHRQRYGPARPSSPEERLESKEK